MEILKREKKRVIAKQLKTHNSIVCGVDNPASIGSIFYWLEGGEVACPFKLNRFHEGHTGIAHGGILSCILDETMGRANATYVKDDIDREISFVTGEYTVRFIKPVMIGEEYLSVAKITEVDGRKRYIEGHIVDKNNVVYAKAKGVWLEVGFVHDSDRTKDIEKNTMELSEDDPKEL